MEYTGASKKKAVGLIISMDCVLQTVDRTNLAIRNISTGTKKEKNKLQLSFKKGIQ